MFELLGSIRRTVFPTAIDKLMKVGGWTEPAQLTYLMQEVDNLPDGSIAVEIGVWQGRSALAMGEACRGTSKRIFAIDPWQDYETKNGPLSTRLEEFGVASIESVYEEFLANLKRLGLEQWVTPVRATSIEAARTWSHGPCGFVFIDGDHNHEPLLADLRAWTELTSGGGVVAGDDWAIDSVKRGLRDFVATRADFEIELPCPDTWALRESRSRRL